MSTMTLARPYGEVRLSALPATYQIRKQSVATFRKLEFLGAGAATRKSVRAAMCAKDGLACGLTGAPDEAIWCESPYSHFTASRSYMLSC